MKTELTDKKFIVFDFDGTLVNSKLPWQDAKKSLEGLANIHKLKIGGLRINEMLYVLESVNEKEEGLCILEKFELKYLHLFKEDAILSALLPELHARGKKIAIFSNNFRPTIEQVLKKHKLLAYIDIIIGRGNVELFKPNPEGMSKIINHWDADKRQTVFIGDNKIDQKAAEASGIDYIHISKVRNISL